MFSERAKQVETVLALLKRGYTPEQIKAVFKGVVRMRNGACWLKESKSCGNDWVRPQSRPSLASRLQDS